MLFSRDDVAGTINRWFEPAWETVRPAPLVRIDFGNGVAVTRTLNGNIATSVCTADGDVLDILPGIYQPNGYLQQLDQLRLLAQYVGDAGKDGCAARLREYHQVQAAALKKGDAPARLVNVAPITKAAIERRVKAVLVRSVPRPPPQPAPVPSATPATGVAGWKELAEDTRVNESLRRRQIHEMLAAAGPVRPAQVTRRLYKEVLHADLDDPYLGLGTELFARYPFAAEDRLP